MTDRAELKRLKQELRQEIFDKLKQIEADLELVGDTDLVLRIDNMREELSVSLIPIG